MFTLTGYLCYSNSVANGGYVNLRRKEDKMPKLSKAVKAKSAPVSTEVVFQGINAIPEDRKSLGVTAADIAKFVQEKAGGNPNNVGVRPVATVDPMAEQPFPFESKRTLYNPDGSKKDTLRGLVVWQLINADSHGGAHITLTDVDNAHKKIKAKKYHALIDALNGGQSPSAKATWGNNFVELYVIPA